MSKFLNEATHKVKKKAERAADRLRPPSQQSRAPSPVLHQGARPTSAAPEAELQLPTPNVAAAMARLAIVPISVAIEPSFVAGPATASARSSPLKSSRSVPAYARPPSPTTILATTGSAVKGLLVAARDGADLFLPLKAALVGVVALWDIWDVRCSTSTYFVSLRPSVAHH